MLRLERLERNAFDQQRYAALHVRVILDGEPLDPNDTSPEAELVRRTAETIAATERVQQGITDEALGAMQAAAITSS